jgi:hypothetical protein
MMGVMSQDPQEPGVPPLRKPPRSALGMREMLVAIGVLVVIVGVLGAITGSCSFAPGGPRVDSSAGPVVDAPAEITRLAGTVPYPVRVPAVPAGWRSNSVDQDLLDPAAPDAGRALRVGYLTPEGRYLRLLQSDGTEEALLASETGGAPVPARGTVEVAGVPYVVYGAEDEEPIWIGELDGVRLLLTGSAAEADFRALAEAVVAGEAAPR